MLHGVQAIRTHIDVTDPTFTGLKAAIFPFILNLPVCLNDTVRDPHLFHHKPIASLPILLGSE